jgi:hypothetical protein
MFALLLFLPSLVQILSSGAFASEVPQSTVFIQNELFFSMTQHLKPPSLNLKIRTQDTGKESSSEDEMFRGQHCK